MIFSASNKDDSAWVNQKWKCIYEYKIQNISIVRLTTYLAFEKPGSPSLVSDLWLSWEVSEPKSTLSATRFKAGFLGTVTSCWATCWATSWGFGLGFLRTKKNNINIGECHCLKSIVIAWTRDWLDYKLWNQKMWCRQIGVIKLLKMWVWLIARAVQFNILKNSFQAGEHI